MDQEKAGSFWEWAIPFLFLVAAGWAVWHMPAYILDFLPSASESLTAQISEIHSRKDVTSGWAGLFGGVADPIDWLALVAIPILFGLGAMNLKVYSMEFQQWRAVDRVATAAVDCIVSHTPRVGAA